MSLSRINIVLGFVLALIVVALIAAAGGDRSQPNIEFLPDMKRSPAYSAYEPNLNLPDKRTLQPPVAGTIARVERARYDEPTPIDAAVRILQNQIAHKLHYTPAPEDMILLMETHIRPRPLHYAPTPEDAVRAGDALINRLATEIDARQASIERGGNIFRVFCTPCHGGGGQGDGLVVQKGYPAPSQSLVTGNSTTMKDGQLFHIITYGKYPEATAEPPRYPRMPSFAPQLTPVQRWDVINYIRSLQRTAKPVE